MQETVLRGKTRNVTRGQRVGSASEGGSLETILFLPGPWGKYGYVVHIASVSSLFRLLLSPSTPAPPSLPPTPHRAHAPKQRPSVAARKTQDGQEGPQLLAHAAPL
jgi:hypothetical protein